MFKAIYSIIFFTLLALVGCSQSTTNNYYYDSKDISDNKQESGNSVDSEEYRSFTSRSF